MTILFFSRLIYPHIGGVEKHVLEVGRRLVKKNHNVIVITERTYQPGSSSAKVTGEIDGIKIYRINVGEDNFFSFGKLRINKKKFRIWWELWKLRNIIKSADVVHCHDVFFWYLPFRFIYFNKPSYTTFHGYETKFPPSKKAIFIRKVSEKLSWGNICVGDYIKKWYGTTSTFITHGGVEIVNPLHPNPLPRGEREMGEGESSKLKILFIGRLEKDTGLLTYLRVLKILKQKEIGFEFEACGDGSLRSKAEQYGKVYGFVKALNQYIEKADIVFASSYLSIMEAMIYKKLVFAVYDNPLKEDYLKMAPFAKWIVIKNSPKDLADKILYFINHDDEKEKIINKGYEWVKTQTWEKIVGIYLKLWKSTSEESIRQPTR